MAGIYIHIPFCVRKCAYCDFYSEPFRIDDRDGFLVSLDKEIELQADFFQQPDYEIDSIFFGGGTPSLLDPDQIGRVLDKLRQFHKFSDNCEISLESNPGTLDERQLKNLLKNDINRLSIGVQSLHKDELLLMERIHTAEQALGAINTARDIGFENIGVDLIFGLPGQKTLTWEKTLTAITTLQINHISPYCLTWSEKTPLGQRIIKRNLPEPAEQIVSEMFLLTSEILTDSGWEHYEISNYARPGFRCRHNEGYWSSLPYLGLGPSAHSYIQNRRQWNIADVSEYNTVLLQNQVPVKDYEDLSPEQLNIERVTLGLRTAKGVLLSEIKGCRDEIEVLCQSGLTRIQNENLILTTRGFLVADEIALKLI